MEASGYAPYDNKSGICADDNPNSTATGSKPGPGTITVDIFFWTHEEAMAFGRQEVKVIVKEAIK